MGKEFEMTTGSKAQVWNGTAKHTSGGLFKKDLFKKDGRIKSKAASAAAKKNNNLVKAGYVTKKGQFGAIKVDGAAKKRSARRSAKRSAKRSVRRSAKRSARRSSKRR
tara:strand:+ start:146 stop:469 length:324 start_codon:yes stop_codon:yes gene_type:complete